ncbi:MAG TPA: hypothetical protein VHB21_07630, partial [Minicystis sp.]|nr:hypothetical protein [Minicystis sp.]
MTEPRVMMEPGYVVDVIDAFDDNGDPFDLNISLGFGYSSKSARILRETNINQPGLTTGGFTAHTLNVADYSATQTRLLPRVDVGIYKDLALHVSLPVLLNYAQSLKAIDGSDSAGSPALAGAPGERLFNLPFTSPTRSGVEYLEVGLDLDILNQARDATKPTWLFGFAGRFSVGTPMHACNPKAPKGEVSCANPGDVNRDGTSQTSQVPGRPETWDATFSGKVDPGVTRGTTTIDVHTLLSKRVKYVEPYGGFSALFEFPTSDEFSSINLDASLVNHPPIVGNMIAGMMIHPWENREKYARFTLDFRFVGTYHSEGRDYSELFDALGSSDAPSLRTPQWAAYKSNPAAPGGCNGNSGVPCSVVDTGSQRTYVNGLSDVQAYGSYRGSVSAMWQASELIRFQFGVGYQHDQAHGITNDQPCNPDFAGGDIGKSGPCHSTDKNGNLTSTGEPNPNYRPTINSVGRRFLVDASNTFDLFA